MEAKAIGRNIGISRKDSIEIANFIRGKLTSKAKVMLEQVIEKKLAVPYKRFNFDRGHKKGIAAGRYPIKASSHILQLIESAEMNALNMGMNMPDLYLYEVIVNKGNGQMHNGRQRGTEMKRTHIHVCLKEVVRKKKENKK